MHIWNNDFMQCHYIFKKYIWKNIYFTINLLELFRHCINSLFNHIYSNTDWRVKCALQNSLTHDSHYSHWRWLRSKHILCWALPRPDSMPDNPSQLHPDSLVPLQPWHPSLPALLPTPSKNQPQSSSCALNERQSILWSSMTQAPFTCLAGNLWSLSSWAAIGASSFWA